MLQAMKYLEEITIKGNEAIETQLESLDLKNVFHVMWVYRNIVDIHRHSKSRFEEIIQDLQNVKVNDFYPAGIILQFLSQLVVRIYKIESGDEEMEYIKKACGYQTLKTEEDLSDLKAYMFTLCKPIVGLHTKEVIDIMALAYEVDGCKDFDKLFGIFEESKDILIELHLHKVRIHRKKTARKAKVKEVDDKSEPLEFKDEEYNLSKDMEKLNLKEGELNTIGDEKPFGDIEEYHLNKAKELLMGFTNPSLKFYIENLSLFLSLRYDEEILKEFVTYTTGGYKCICASKIFKLTTLKTDKLDYLISAMEGAEKEILRASGLKATPQTFKMYIDWCVSSLQGISIALVSDFVDIAKIYIVFARQYKNEAMAKLFTLLWNCNIKNVEEEVKGALLASFSEIVEILLGVDKHGNPPEDVVVSFNKINSFMDAQVDIKNTFEKVIEEVRHSLPLKKVFIYHLEALRYFDHDLILHFTESLLVDLDLDWRYRMNILEETSKHSKALKIDFNNIVKCFINDKVFIVRMKAKELQNQQ